MSDPRILPDDYGLYRCDICGHCYNRDEVSERSQVVNGLRIFSYTCDGCNTTECTMGGKTKGEEE